MGERRLPRLAAGPLAHAGWILALALIVRIALIAQMGNRYYFADTGEYEAAARSILAGHGPGADYARAPLYPALMAVGFWLGGVGNYVAARVLQLVFGLGVVALTMALVRRVGTPVQARLAGLAAALAPTLVFTSGMLYPTSLYTFLLLAVALVAHGIVRRPGLLRAALLGVLLTLAWLTDAIAQLPLAALLLWMLFGARRDPSAAGARPRLAAGVAVAVAVALLVALPWQRYQERTYGRSAAFMPKAQYVLYAARSRPDIGGAREIRDTSAVFRPLGAGAFLHRELGLFRRQPLGYFSDWSTEFLHFFNPMPDRLQTRNMYNRGGLKALAAIYFTPVLALAILGLFWGGVALRDRLFLALMPLTSAGTYAFFFTQTRYRVPVEPFLLALAALGVSRLFRRGVDADAPGGSAPPPPR